MTRFVCFSIRKLRVAAAVWALALSWWSSKANWIPRRPPGRQWLIYQLELTVFLFSRGTVATWPDLENKHATICFATLFWSLEFHRWGLTWEDPNRWLLLCFVIVLKDPRFITSYNVPDATRSSSVKFLQHMCTIRPYLSSALQSSCKGPNVRNVSRCRDDHGSHFLMKCPVHLVSSCVILGSSLISYFILTTFSTVGCYWATITVVVFHCLSSKLKFSVPFSHSEFCRRLLPETCGQNRKAVLIRLRKSYKIMGKNLCDKEVFVGTKTSI